jgi:hypothetical protein
MAIVDGLIDVAQSLNPGRDIMRKPRPPVEGFNEKE